MKMIMKLKWCDYCQKSTHDTDECWSTHAVPPGRRPVFGMPKPKSGFEDDPLAPQCADLEHNPPTHLHIPTGKIYRHVCPSCGHQALLRPSPITY